MMFSRNVSRHLSFTLVAAMVALSFFASDSTLARQTPKHKGADAPQNFLRQHNNYSNISFYFTNKGVLFNNDQSAGLLWPRSASDKYIFGGGLWFATKKNIQGRRRKLCELGYNPNSGAGWYMEGEQSQLKGPTDGAQPAAKYISYVSPRYDKTSGKFLQGTSNVVPAPYYSWPLWDTAADKTFKRNFYFGDYISDVTMRDAAKLPKKNGKPAVPAVISEEDVANFYTDADPSNNPDFKPNTGYPFGLDIQEVIYSWSFGRYRDMIFVRHRVTNTSKDTLYDCWMAPAFDPDIGADPNNDINSYVSDSVGGKDAKLAGIRQPYRDHPSLLNMGYQYSQPESGKELGQLGFSFLESPVVNSNGQIVSNDDSVGLRGYGPKSLFQTSALGLVTFDKWTLATDPSTQDLRYDFVSNGGKALAGGVVGDMRLLFATGPFTLLPGNHVETTIAIGIAKPSITNPAQNFQALLSLMDFAHQVFGEPDSLGAVNGDTAAYVLSHFLSPVPPDVPNIQTHSLDRAVLVTWDSTAERSVDPVSLPSNSLPFLGYQLWRSSRSDRDSTIRPDGINPDVMLGSWQLYDLRADSNFDSKGHFRGFRYARTNAIAHPIPHSYLDIGDDNHDGVLTGTEGLINGVKYYYYLLAYDEYDSVNRIGPLFTSVVPPKNMVAEVPSKPPYLQVLTGLKDSIFSNDCQARGGMQSITIDVADTGRFTQLFTNDQICVSMQPRWVEDADKYLGFSHLVEWVDVTDTRNNLANTYQNLHNPTGTPATEAYYSFSGINLHVPGTVTADSAVPQEFTTDNSAFAPNQVIDQTFRVLVDYQIHQDSRPYRLRQVTVSGPGNPDASIMRLSMRTSLPNTPGQDILHLDSNGTRPSYLGALGNATYELSFDAPIKAPAPVLALDGTPTSFQPDVYPIHIRMADCPASELRHVQDTLRDEQLELNGRYYTRWASPEGPQLFTDPDRMYVPNPGWYAMDVYHYQDNAALNASHENATQLASTWGPYYWPITGNGNSQNGVSHLAIHRLRLAGAEIIFNAPGANFQTTTGDSLPTTPAHMSDFQPGDKVTFAFSGVASNVPFPGACFQINTPSGSALDFKNASLYNGSVLNQVSVVPNPYIVTHEGQSSTDNAKLYFTRLPPRCTIEIYSIDGTLVNTIEHHGYAQTNLNDPTQAPVYSADALADRSTVEEWNLLTSGKQRVGSQVLIARIIAKDVNNAVIAETTTKFAVVIGGIHVTK